MAMIKCPECGKEVSDKALACPECGYDLAIETRRTELSPVEVKKGKGILYIIIGILDVIVGAITSPVLIGVIIFVMGVKCIRAGVTYVVGMQEGKCPYCEREVILDHRVKSYKCRSCKKTSKKTDTHLEKM